MALFYLPLVAARCRTVKFFKEEGVALQNHVIKTVTDSNPISCGWQCADTPLCFSMNVRRLPNGWVTCELNNSSKIADPRDLISSPGSHYYEPPVILLSLLAFRERYLEQTYLPVGSQYYYIQILRTSTFHNNLSFPPIFLRIPPSPPSPSPSPLPLPPPPPLIAFK